MVRHTRFAWQRPAFPARLAGLLAVGLAASHAAADIYQWEYINPNDPSQGVRQSSTLCLGGAGANAAPYAWLASRNLNSAYLIGADLTSAALDYSYLYSANLTNANLTGATITYAQFNYATGFTAQQLYSTASYQQRNLVGVGLGYRDLSGWNFANQSLFHASLHSANLTNANLSNDDLSSTSLTDANLTGATITGTHFGRITAQQLYSTASYQNHDLSGVGIGGLDLSGWNFSGQTITGANFNYATGFTSAQLSSTASYQSHDLSGLGLSGLDLGGWSFANQNLTKVSLSSANLANANLTGATITGTHFDSATGLTAQQLYSTASYQSHDLSGVVLSGRDLSGWNFANQNLTKVSLSSANLTNANLTGATITGADFSLTGLTAQQLYSTASYQNHDLSGVGLSGRDLSGWNLANQNLSGASLGPAPVNLRGADLRGSTNGYFGFVPMTNTTNTIRPDGSIQGLNLTAGQSLTIRDFDPLPGNQSIPIRVRTSATVSSGASIVEAFSDATWGSTISFDPGISVQLNGILDLALAEGADPRTVNNHTFQLFDFTGVNPLGQFTILSHLPDWMTYDASRLYTDGTLTFTPEPATLLPALALLTALRRRKHP